MPKQKDKTQLDEFQSSYGVNASVADPVAKPDAHANRHADNLSIKDGEPTNYPKSKMIADMLVKAYSAKGPELEGLYKEFMKMGGGVDAVNANRDSITPKNKPVAEDLEAIFSQLELTEEARSKAVLIFEGAVNSKLIELRAELDEAYEEKLLAALEEATAEIEESADKYLSFVADQWLEENRLEVSNGIRADLAESFISGLKTLFEEHYVELPEDKVDIVAAMSDKVTELEEQLNVAQNALLEKQVEQKVSAKKEIVSEMSKDMTATQADKFRALAESVEFDNEESFRTNLKTLAETFVIKTKPATRSAEESLNEEVHLDGGAPAAPVNDPTVSAVVNFVGSRIRR